MATSTANHGFRSAGLVVIIGLLSAWVLSELDVRLAPARQDAKKQFAMGRIRQVASDFDNNPYEDALTLIDSTGPARIFYRLAKSKYFTGAVFPVSIPGRRGRVSLLAGIGWDGRMMRVLLEHPRETYFFTAPGLNQKWFDQFHGLAPAEIKLKQFGGKIEPLPQSIAVSVRMTDALRLQAEFFYDHRNEMLGQKT